MSAKQKDWRRSTVFQGTVWLGIVLVAWALGMFAFKSVQCKRVADFLNISHQQVRPARDHPLFYAECFSLHDDDGTKIGYVTTDGPTSPRYIGFYPPHGPTVDCTDQSEALITRGRTLVARYAGTSESELEHLSVEKAPGCSRAVIACDCSRGEIHYEVVVNTYSQRVVSIRRSRIQQ